MTLAEEIREFKKKHGCSTMMATVKALQEMKKGKKNDRAKS